MREASKLKKLYGDNYLSPYLNGKVVDIGCGQDKVIPDAIAFDKGEGDANSILNYHKPESFDTVHSSHCLEHVFKPEKCLLDWWALVKPGGFIITIVPDEDLYEQGIWPSIWNPDHKATFRF